MAAIGNGYYSNRSDNSFVYGGSSTKEYPFRLGSTSVSLGLLNAAKGLYVGTSPIYHPEAINWVNRAQANDGTISTDTLGAVSAFCYAIDAANLRDKFLRLNLFCGSDLGACCTPLYRGPSFSGDQYGNSVDTNMGSFIIDDYTETGSGGGLSGNGTDYLDTGLNTTTPFTDMGMINGSYMPINDMHVLVYLSTLGTTESWVGGLINGFVFGFEANEYPGQTAFWGGSYAHNADYPDGMYLISTSCANEGNILCNFKSGNTKFLIENTDCTSSSNDIVTGPWDSGTNIYIMRGYYGIYDQPPGYSPTYDTVAGYSLGSGFTSSEATAYNTIMNSFQSALGRSI